MPTNPFLFFPSSHKVVRDTMRGMKERIVSRPFYRQGSRRWHPPSPTPVVPPWRVYISSDHKKNGKVIPFHKCEISILAYTIGKILENIILPAHLAYQMLMYICKTIHQELMTTWVTTSTRRYMTENLISPYSWISKSLDTINDYIILKPEYFGIHAAPLFDGYLRNQKQFLSHDCTLSCQKDCPMEYLRVLYYTGSVAVPIVESWSYHQ